MSPAGRPRGPRGVDTRLPRDRVERSGAGRHTCHPEETMEHPRSEVRLGDFFVVSTEGDTWCVSTEMARHIDACLEADPMPRWVVFVDVTGARVRVRSDRIESLTQRSVEQRAISRTFERMAMEERRADGLVKEDKEDEE